MALMSALARLPDVEPHAVAFVPGLAAATRKEFEGRVSVDYLPAPRRFRSLTLHVRERHALAGALTALRPDVVHAQDALRHGFVCLKTFERARVLLTIHGIAREELRFATGPTERLRVAATSIPLQGYCIRHARFLTFSTTYAREYLGDRVRGRSWEIANPIPDRFFVASRRPEAGRVLHIGKLIPLKRLLDLVEALPAIASVVPETHLCVAGGEEYSEYAQEVRARVRQLGLESRVEFRGPLSPEELVDEYRRASVFVLPSGQENSPLTIGEAMAAGVPVVATRVGGVPSLVEEGRTGSIVEPGDVAALAERVVEVLGDRERASALGAAARETAEKTFRIDVVARAMRALYEEMVRSC